MMGWLGLDLVAIPMLLVRALSQCRVASIMLRLDVSMSAVHARGVHG
jgi:hypothetical protein